MDVPDENIVSRMGGRRACVACGATYHVEFNAPKSEGVCDKHPLIHKRLCLHAQFRSALNIGAENVPGGNMGDPILCGNLLSLSSLACSRSA